MNFNSLRYLIFLPVMILLHWLVPSRYRWIPLLIGSYYFYACFQWYFCFLMLGMTLLSYLAGILTEKTDSPKKKKAILLTALVLCLSLLFVFKYLSFTVNAVISLADLLGARQDSLVLGILLPAGISFYTFQAISYVVDVGKGKFPAEHHFGYFALYLSFFPQLVAGPIERPGDLLPQLRAERKPVLSDFTEGFRYLLLGFFKKAVIADLLAPFVEKVYSSPATMNGEAVFLGTLFFAFQIYGDFAGYSDIALGSARMMGIRLSDNFDAPYLSTSVRSFWHRWHKTLTRFLTDYVYIPLGGNRKGKVRQCLNILFVFLLSGLWHGANWTFVLWGLLHGVYLVIETCLEEPLRKWAERKKISLSHPGFRFLGWLYTSLLVLFAWIFFRASSLESLGILLSKLFTGWSGDPAGTAALLSLTPRDLLFFALGILALSLFRFLPKENPDLTAPEGKLSFSAISLTALTSLVLIFLIGLAWIDRAGTGAESQFLYFQF